MKNLNLIFVGMLLLSLSCKTDKKEEEQKEVVTPISVLEKVANAHGYENWKNIEQIAFTFNVDRDSTHFERSWIWNIKKNEVTHIAGADSLTYNRKNMDSVALRTNGGFINDRYWLLAPFNLIWDAHNFEHTLVPNDTAPISQKTMQKLTVVYGSEGGYTPGDAYDFYFGDDYVIQEWVFRKGNQAEPSMITTWENHTENNGIKFATDHKKDKENFNLYFTNVVATPTN